MGHLLHVLVAAAVAAAASTESKLDLILYGADGCVGHFAASHLAQQPGLKWAIAGRTKEHLDALATQLAKEGGKSSSPEIIVAALDEGKAPWVRRARAVVTAAGPFSIHSGETLVRACAENGVHYADTSDEFYWQRRMMDSYGANAKKSGARMVLSSGFCAMAGDLGSQLAISGLAAGSEVELDAWLETYNGGLSAGVIATKHALQNASYPKEWGTDPYVLAPDADASLRLDTELEGMSYPHWVSGEGLVVANIFGPYDARLLRRSFTHLGQKVRLRVGSTPGMYTKWAAFLAAHPGSWGELSKCPPEAVYQGGSWAYRFKAKAGGKKSTVLLSGEKDPGYHFTGWGLAEAGLCLAGKTQGCVKAGSAGGVYTSMSALDHDVLRQRLESVDLMKTKMEVETDEGDTVVV